MTTNSSPTIFETYSPASVRSAGFHHQLRHARTHKQYTPPLPTTPCRHGQAPGKVERCVVVAKQQDGYGLTVTGEHPVYVETVKAEGAAAKAGVRPGDQIVKINGMPVLRSNHFEVLRMISAGPNVALTLLGEAVSCPICRPQFFDFTEASRNSSFNAVDHRQPQRRAPRGPDSGQSTCPEDRLNTSDKVEPVRQWVNSGGRLYAPGSLRDLTQELRSGPDDDQPNASPMNPFGNAQDLRRNPDELALFCNYSVHHGEPSSMLFYLITDAFQACVAPVKELRRFAYEIFSTFLIPGAPLLVPGISQVQIQAIDRTLASYNNNPNQEGDQLKKAFISCRSRALSAMEVSYADFKKSPASRAKCEPGSSMNVKTKAAEQVLMNLLEELAGVAGNDGEKGDARAWALTMAVATLIKVVLNVKPSQSSEKLLEKCPTFVTAPSKSGMFRMKPIMVKRSTQVMDHQFNLHTVYLTVHCYQCRDAVWGVQPQAYFCQNCDVIVHKHCTAALLDRCYPVTQKSARPAVAASAATLAPRQPRPRTVSNLNLSSTTSALSQFAAAPVQQGRSVQPLDSRSMGFDPGCTTANPVAQAMDSALADLPPSEPPPAIPVPARAIVENAKSNSSDSGIGTDVDNRPVSRTQSIKTQERLKPQLEDVSENPAESEHEQSLIGVRSLDVRSVSGSSAVSVNADGMLDIAENDSDLEIDVELPPLDQIISWQILKRIDPKVRKLQESINELYHTERSHVRNLKVIYRIFHRPIVENKLAGKEFLKTVFANLDELIEIHSSMSQKMRLMADMWKKDSQYDGLYAKLGSTVAGFFLEEDGDRFKKAASTFCQDQQHGLKLLSEKRAKDENLAAFLIKAEGNPLCRKFQLKDLLPVEMQRLVKYPLLLDTILRYTPESSEEYQQYTQASSGAKKLLSAVNTAKRDAENRRYLEDIHRKIEMPTTNRPYDDVIRRFDIMQYRYVYDGDVTWRHSRGKSDMHLVLLDYLLLILTKSSDGKYFMRTQETNAVPLLWLPSVTVEEKTGDKRAFVIFYERDLRTYELQAPSVTEKKTWEQLLKSQIAAAKSDLPSNFEMDIMTIMPKLKSSQPSTDQPSPSTATELAEEVQVTMHAGLVKASEIVVQRPQVMVMEQAEAAKVQVQQPQVSGTSHLTTAEKLQRNDQMIAKALLEKHEVMAGELMEQKKLTKDDMEAIAEALTGMNTISLKNRKPAELALSAIVHGMMGRRQASDKVSEEAEKQLPFVPCYKLTAVAAPLMNHLTALSQVIKEQREEIENLKKEMAKETLTEPPSTVVLRSTVGL